MVKNKIMLVGLSIFLLLGSFVTASEHIAESIYHIRWNDITGTPHSFLGINHDLGVGDIQNEDEAVQAATKFISDNSVFLGTDNMELRLIKVEKGNGEWYVIYQQYHNNIPVYNGMVGMTISDDGKLVSGGSDVYSNVYSSDTIISKESAIQIATNKFQCGDNPQVISETGSPLLIYPQDNNIFFTVWDITLRNDRPLRIERYFVDSVSGDIVFSYDLVMSEVSGPKSPCTNIGGTPPSSKENNISFLLYGVVILVGYLLFKSYRGKKHRR